MTCYANTFHQLDMLLTKNRQYWQFVPFADEGFTWQQQHPDFCQWLESIDDQSLQQLNQDHDALLAAFEPWIPDAKILADLAKTPSLQKYVKIILHL